MYEGPRQIIGRNVKGAESTQRRVKIRNVKNGSFCCFVRYAMILDNVGGMVWPKTGATHLFA